MRYAKPVVQNTLSRRAERKLSSPSLGDSEQRAARDTIGRVENEVDIAPISELLDVWTRGDKPKIYILRSTFVAAVDQFQQWTRTNWLVVLPFLMMYAPPLSNSSRYLR